MKRLLAILLTAVGVLTCSAQSKEIKKYQFAYGDTVRTYAMYLPKDLKPGAPLVIYTHGYGSKTRWRTGLNGTAEREGFAVCYPDGAPDSRGKDGWKVGYPPQESMTIDEADFFTKLKEEVCSRFNLSRENSFMAGMSNGGDLCYQLAFTAPGLFRAYASVAGLLFECTYLNNPLPQPVPFMEIHGDADKTSMWEGDHENTGGWGRYIPVPLAVSTMATANRCCSMRTETFPTLTDSTRTITRTIYYDAPSGFDVEVYKVGGAPHSWHVKDVNTHEVVWRFFKQYLVNRESKENSIR